jgi:predicted nucleotidyltransferase
MRDEVPAGYDAERLGAVCRKYGISVLLVFGSVARGEATPSSDVDLLYELRPGARLGWEIEDLSDALAEIFGRPVDLVSRTALHPMLRSAVLDEARPVYAA